MAGELYRREVVALERIASALEPKTDAQVGRPLRQVNTGALVGVPSLLGRFSVDVPEAHLDDETVGCWCGSRTVVPPARIIECVGGCGRFFLRVKGRVLCAFETPASELVWVEGSGWERVVDQAA